MDPTDSRVRVAVERARENCRWDYDGSQLFDGEVEPCINGMTVGIGSYFGERVDVVVEKLLFEQLDDGGWNCDAEKGLVRSSFHTTIAVLDGHDAVAVARRRGNEYLLERRLMRRLSSGDIVNPAWLQFSFPPRWPYDVLRALDYFRAAGTEFDPRMGEALELAEAKRGADGRWLLKNTHPGSVHFIMEPGNGSPSRWNTLRAMRSMVRLLTRTAPRLSSRLDFSVPLPVSNPSAQFIVSARSATKPSRLNIVFSRTLPRFSVSITF